MLSTLIDLLEDGFETLGPRFQGGAIGFLMAMYLMAFVINLALWG